MPTKERFFNDDGKLDVCIPVAKVRWIDFLVNSRLLNSEEGGWNFKKYWRTRGLKPLSEASNYLKTWTQNSLKDAKTYPRPREKCFNLDRKFTDERVAAVAATHGKSVAACLENELNACLFNKHAEQSPSSPFQGSDLIGYEVPLCDAANEQLKVDLLALDRNNRHLSLIELKQANSPSNSPLLALVELICYALQLKRCEKALLRENDAVLRPEHFRIICLLIAAPAQYWTHWGCDSQQTKVDLREEMNRILEKVNQASRLKETRLLLGDFVTIEQVHIA